jgi:Domain of unknown function (DUF4928)
MSSLDLKLAAFAKERRFRGKGPLSVALHVTRYAIEHGLPLSPDVLVAKKKTQVKGLGMASVQAILSDHGIERIFAKEAGRTSRGSVENMREYVAFLNALKSPVNLRAVEAFWITKVKEFFAGKPFKFRIDASLSLRAAVKDILAQARHRQLESAGQRFEGAMLQHLVGAKLDIVLGEGVVTHHPVAEADAAEARAGDFTPGDTVIHVTTHPSEALMARCRENLDTGLRPMLITLAGRAAAADGLADVAGIADRLEIVEIEQFLATNVHEWAAFKRQNHRLKVEALFARYNALVDLHEHDPSLRIEIA